MTSTHMHCRHCALIICRIATTCSLAMRSVDAICAELKAVSSSVSKRFKSDSTGFDNLREKAARQIAFAISNLDDLDFKSSEKLYEAITASGMNDVCTTILTGAVDSQLDSHLDSQTAESGKHKLGQELMHPENWMIEELYTLCGDKSKSFLTKLQATADHVIQCQVHTPSEKTYGIWLSFVVCMHYKVLPSYNVLRQFLLDMKNMISAARKQRSFAVIWEYPKSPELLAQHVHDEIFKNGCIPIQINLPRMRDVFTNHMPLRGNSKLLKSDKSASVDLDVDPKASPDSSTSKKATRRSSSSLGGSLKSASPSPSPEASSRTKVKAELTNEPEDSLASPPDWAADLMSMLQGRESKGTTPCLPAPPADAMQALTDGPEWAKELHRLLDGACNRAAAVKSEKPSTDEPTESSKIGMLQSRLRPKGNLSLRHTHATADPQLGASNAEPRPTMAELEDTAATALKSVASKRAEAAAARKKEAAAKKREEAEAAKKKAEAAKKKAGDAKAKAKEAETAPAANVRRRIWGKQSIPATRTSRVAARTRSSSSRVVARKRPAAAVVAYTSENPPLCPGVADKASIEYNQGKIYNTKEKFRVLRDKSDSYTENSFSHKKWGREEGFAKSLQAIDAYWANVMAQGVDVD